MSAAVQAVSSLPFSADFFAWTEIAATQQRDRVAAGGGVARGIADAQVEDAPASRAVSG